MADFVAVLTSIKTALDITKMLRDTNTSLDRAELKMKLADIMGPLADARIELANIQQSVTDRDARIAELEAALETKAHVVRSGDAFYRIAEDGTPTGEAHCLRCWEDDHRLRQLVNLAANYRIHVCPTCSTQYNNLSTSRK